MFAYHTEQAEYGYFFVAKASIRVMAHFLTIKPKLFLIILTNIEINRYYSVLPTPRLNSA